MLKELLDSPKCQFKLIVHYSNPQRFPQTSFQGHRASDFEPIHKNSNHEIDIDKIKFLSIVNAKNNDMEIYTFSHMTGNLKKFIKMQRKNLKN